MKEIKWRSLLQSLQSGQCGLVLGPDIPVMAANPVDQGGEEASLRDVFGRYLTAQLEEGEQAVAETAMFAIAQQYSEWPDSVNIGNIASRFFGDVRHHCGTLHTELAKFPFSVVLTTCYDDLFATALKNEGKKPRR